MGKVVERVAMGSRTAQSACTARLAGLFRLAGPDGEDLTPTGAKARAVIALLLTSAERTMSRVQLQDKLWSDRGPKQGADSLRQALTEIRRRLGPHRDLLHADRQLVRLDAEGLLCDLDRPEEIVRVLDPRDRLPEFLEGLSIADPEFEHWVRDQRTIVADRLEELRGACPGARLPGLLGTPTVAVLGRAGRDDVCAEMLSDGVLKNMGEWSTLRIVEGETGASGRINYAFECRSLPAKDRITLHMRLSDRCTGDVFWSCTRAFGRDEFDCASEPVARLRNHLCDRAIVGMLSGSDNAAQRAELAGFRVVCDVFRTAGADLEQTRARLTAMAESGNRGIHLAWLAFLTTYEIGERRAADPERVRDAAESLIRAAISREPYHSMVLALCSYVRSFVFRDYFTGYDLARRSIDCNRSNPLAWAALGAANFYLGRHEAAREAVLRARAISGGGPYHYLIESLCCISATLTDRLDEAEMYGRLTHHLAPTYTPPLRYLTAIYTRRGEHEKAAEVRKKLLALEPDFSLELMQERSYPVAALRDSGFFDFPLARQV